MSRTSEKFDVLRQMMEQLINRMDRLETRSRSSRSHNRRTEPFSEKGVNKYHVEGKYVSRAPYHNNHNDHNNNNNNHHYQRRSAYTPQIGMTDSPSGRTVLPPAVPDVSKPLDDVPVTSIQETPFVKEIEQPKEVPLVVADPTTLHLIRETPETKRQPLIPVEVSHYTVIEQQIVSCANEVSTKIDKVQHQDEVVDRKIDDNQIVVVHPDVVTTKGSGDKIVVTIIWSPAPYGREDCGGIHKEEFSHNVTTGVAVGKHPRPGFTPFGGNIFVQVPFDPGIFRGRIFFSKREGMMRSSPQTKISHYR